MRSQHPEPAWNGPMESSHSIAQLAQFVFLTAAGIGKRRHPGFCYLLFPPFQKEHLGGEYGPSVQVRHTGFTEENRWGRGNVRKPLEQLFRHRLVTKQHALPLTTLPVLKRRTGRSRRD